MPPRFRPFTSFLTQGMQNTNQNINNNNQPQFNSPFGNPYNPPMTTGFGTGGTGTGGGGLMEAKPWWERGPHESEGGGAGEPGGSTGPGGLWTPGMGQEPMDIVKDLPGEGSIHEWGDYDEYNWAGESGGSWHFNDYEYIMGLLPEQLQESIEQQGGFHSMYNPGSVLYGLLGGGTQGNMDYFDWTESQWNNVIAQEMNENFGMVFNPSTGDWVIPPDAAAGIVDVIEPDVVGGGGSVSPGDEAKSMAGTAPYAPTGPDYTIEGPEDFTGGQESLHANPYHPQYDYNNDGFVDATDIATAQSQGVSPEILAQIQSFMTGSPVNYDLLSNLMNTWQGGLGQEASQFTGGGGVGGQRAKRLYYAPTQGGFASVGEGMKKQQEQPSLEDLLKKLQG